MNLPPPAAPRYNARESERRWQQRWDELGIFATQNSDPREKYYVLEMFPYPSGRIHIGHVRNYTLGDVIARYMRAKGFNVLHPMGWDAFGLPAENAAMERKVAPKAWTYDNIAAMKKQLKSIGLSLDWSREFATCDPSYYKHQQKLFLDFLKAGLAEREQRKLNWDPVDMTVLANEQVIDGRGWRSGAVVEQREMNQWVFKITKYAQELLDALDTLDRWPDKVRLMQRNWIGRSEGMLVRFALDPATAPSGETELKVFTTRHDTLFGAKFMAIAADHPLAQVAAAKNAKLAEFIAEAKRHGTAQEIIDTAEKLGFDTGIKAIHPFDASWKLPVYVANFVLMEYGTGAIFGCPAHDQRDLDFVNKYGLGNTPVVCPPDADPKSFVITDVAYDGDGRMINSRFLDGMTIDEAKEEVARRLESAFLPPPERGRSTAKRSGGGQADGRPPPPTPPKGGGGVGAGGGGGGGPSRRTPTPTLPLSGGGRRGEAAARRRAQGKLPPARLGHFAAALLGLPDSGDPLRKMRRGAGARQGLAGGAAGGRELRQARQRARPSSDLEACRLPAMRRASAARHRYHGHLCRFVVVFCALHRSVERAGADHAARGQPHDAGRPVYRRRRARHLASALCPLLHPRHEGDRPYRHGRTVRRHVHARNGGARDLPEGRRQLRHAGRSQDRGRPRRPPRHAPRYRRGSHHRPDRKNVEVEAQHRRSRRHHRELRRRRRALVHAVGLAAGPRRDLER
jgi:hypothetical protein